jgi:hypothetical protein
MYVRMTVWSTFASTIFRISRIPGDKAGWASMVADISLAGVLDSAKQEVDVTPPSPARRLRMAMAKRDLILEILIGALRSRL